MSRARGVRRRRHEQVQDRPTLRLVDSNLVDVQSAQELADLIAVLVKPRIQPVAFPVEQKPDAAPGSPDRTVLNRLAQGAGDFQTDARTRRVVVAAGFIEVRDEEDFLLGDLTPPDDRRGRLEDAVVQPALDLNPQADPSRAQAFAQHRALARRQHEPPARALRRTQTAVLPANGVG